MYVMHILYLQVKLQMKMTLKDERFHFFSSLRQIVLSTSIYHL